MARISFGTDGWRGVIADDYTFDNVSIVAQAVADYINEEEPGKNKGLVVGYDTRFLSDAFARRVADVVAANGIPVLLSDGPVPSPAVSLAVRENCFSGGVMITASHNPAIFNGLKFKCPYGGSASEEVTGKIEALLYRNEVKETPISEIELVDFGPLYIDKVRSYVDLGLVRGAGLRVVYDSMYGAGNGFLERVLDGACEVVHIHGERDPSFGGISPEPVERNFGDLKKKVKEVGADVGLATDGDADRVGAVDENGNYLSPQETIALLLLHMLESRPWSGDVAKTISTTFLINRIARKYGREVYETPVGFKHICELMIEEDILMGGEESGGIGYKNYIPERDGILSGLLLLEMMARRRKGLGAILVDLEGEFGNSSYMRVDVRLEGLGSEGYDREGIIRGIMGRIPGDVVGLKVDEIKTTDGVKLILEDDSWLLIRFSGTEPLLRIYAESPVEGRLADMIEAGKRLGGVK